MTVLTAEQDAFGAALVAHLDGRTDGRILMLEVEDGRMMPAMRASEFFATPSEWLPWERDILEDLEGPVLDLGCGAGRHAPYLQTQSLDVTGVDASAGAIDVCLRRGVRDVRLADLRTPPTDARWGSVLLMCGNLGLAGGWDETRRLLGDLHAVCRPGAVLAADTVDPTQNDDSDSVAYRDAKRAAGRHDGEVGLRLRFGELVTPFWNLLNVPPRDLEALAADTGWDVETQIVDGMDHAVRLRRA